MFFFLLVVDEMENLIINQRDSPEFDKRNDECYEIIKKMRYEAIPSLETSGDFIGMPTISELQFRNVDVRIELNFF